LPLTGSMRQHTDSMVNAMKMALDEIGNKLGDTTIAYQALDDATVTKAGSREAAGAGA